MTEQYPREITEDDWERWALQQDAHKARLRNGHRTNWGLVALVVLLVLLVVTSTVYGVLQHGHATKALQQRDDTRTTLAQTRKTQHETLRQLSTTRDSLDSARSTVTADEDQLKVCLSVSKAARELFRASSHLSDAMSNWPNDIASIDEATANVTKVQHLIDAGGFTGIDDMIAGCSGEGGTGI